MLTSPGVTRQPRASTRWTGVPGSIGGAGPGPTAVDQAVAQHQVARSVLGADAVHGRHHGGAVEDCALRCHGRSRSRTG